MRVGIGYDIHALKKGRKLVLGGVTIPFSKGLAGHSDADVVLHAIIDAVLGALAEGDIGDHFPDGDARYRGMNSALFVKKVKILLKKRRLRIAHIDTAIIAEAPKLAPYKDRIREKIAKVFEVSPRHVGVKAKTNEGFGLVGKNQAIACLSIVSLTG